MRLFQTQPEQDLVHLVAGADPSQIVATPARLRAVTKAAREHGVESVLPRDAHDPVAALARDLALRMQHEARLREVLALGAALAAKDVPCLLLKGVGLAERLYNPPCMRGSTDIDLLVAPADLSRTLAVVDHAGYEVESGATAQFFRNRHFHVHAMQRTRGTPLEVHFMAYRGFGSQITAADLFEQALPFQALPGLLVPAPARELVYLAVHAAAHRFVRMGWLLDLVLLIGKEGPDIINDARVFARRVRFSQAFEVALLLLKARFGVAVPGRSSLRARLAESIAEEPASPLLRSATRFLYSSLLCDGARERATYASRAVVDKVLLARV
jgi:nicotinamidase-related amidase